MTRTAFSAALILSAVCLGELPALGERAYVNLTTAQKAMQSDAVVVGKVTEIEKDEVEVLPHAGAADKVRMKVGVVKVETGLIVPTKNVTHIKVLFAPGAATGTGGRPRNDYAPVGLAEGQEALFFLTRHPTAPGFYTVPAGSAPVEAKAETYKDEVGKVKAVVATLADPMKALKAEKAEDRCAAAATLIQKYRRGLNVPAKQEPIPAEETKAILKVLAEADWTSADNPTPNFDYQSAPNALAGQLGLYPGAGGMPPVQPKPGESYNAKFKEAFKTWLEKSGDKFEIKRFVPKD